MAQASLHYIGEKITIKAIRDFILDFEISECDTIFLNSENFDDIVLEHRDTYNQSLSVPYYLLRILVMEDTRHHIPSNRIGVVKNDVNRYEDDYQMLDSSDESFRYDTIYRCGWCGNVVDSNGAEFSSEERAFKIKIHLKYRETITEIHVDGKCCPNGDS